MYYLVSACVAVVVVSAVVAGVCQQHQQLFSDRARCNTGRAGPRGRTSA